MRHANRKAKAKVDAASLLTVPLVQIMGNVIPAAAAQPVRDTANGTTRFYDAIEMDAADSKYAPVMMVGGYIKAMPRVARTGIQLYSGAECGRPDLDEVRVYRPEDSVFAKDALHSLTHLPLTIEHPRRMVDASNWKDVAVGETGDDILRDGGTIRVPMILRDSKAIQIYKDGKRQLSVGYDCDLDWKAGTTPEGEAFDATQRNIKGNHIAFTSLARGGPILNVGDGIDISKGEEVMNTINLKTVMVDGIECQMSDTAAQIVNRTITALNTQLDAWKKKDKEKDDEDEENGKKDAAKDTALAAKDAEIATLKAQLTDAVMTPAKLDALVKERTTVIDKAAAYMGKAIKADGMSISDVRRVVVDSKLGDVAKGWTDDQVAISFSSLTADTKVKANTGNNGINDAARVFSTPHRPSFVVDTNDAREAAYDKYNTDIGEAWRGKTAAAE